MSPEGGSHIIAESKRSRFTDIPKNQQGSPLTRDYKSVRNDSVILLWSNDIQDQVISRLSDEHGSVRVVPHSFLDDAEDKWTGERHLRSSALVSVSNYYESRTPVAIWVDALGVITEAEAPFFCYGNPDYADCIAGGSCRRSHACND